MNKIFDLELLTIHAIVDGAPIDVTGGAVVDGDFLKIAKEDADETKTRKGTKGESYTVLAVEDSIRMVTITYIPGSPAVTLFQGLRQAKKQFGISIINNSSPKFKFFASSCVVGKEPETVINGKDGFKDYEFEIRCSQSSQVWE